MSAPIAKIPAYSRSRQTVVCTECKRLKIKCDRQSPCSGCAKRSNDPRVCVYLTANTERPDIGVLWTNQRESDLKIDSLAVRVDEIQDAFLPRKLVIPPLVIVSSFRGTPNIFQLDTVSALWTTTLGIPLTRVDALVNTGPAQPTSRLFMVEEAPHLYASFFAPDPNPQPGLRQRAVITAALLKHLPSTLSREALLSSLNSTLIIHPVCSFHHLEARLRFLDDANLALQTTTDISVAFFAVAAAAMTLGSLAYQAERRAWKMQPDFPESERDITKLFDLARLAIRLAGDTDEDRNDVILALLLLIIFTLHSLELDGHTAVVSGVASTPLHAQLGQLLDQLKRKAESKSLLLEVKQVNGSQTLWGREQRRMLAAAVAYYDFYVSDLIGNRLSIDHASYTTEPPAPVDDRTFRPSSTNLPPPPTGNTNHSTLFANQRSRILKVVLQARSEVIYGRDQEKDLMCQAAEQAEKEKAETEANGTEEKKRIMPFQSPASDILEMWDERLHQQRENLPRQMVFDSSPEYAADVGVVFAGEPRPAGVYENNVTLAMGYTIAQQTEIAAFIAYHRMRHAALLLENALVYKPRGAPPHGSGTVTMVRILDAAQDLLAAIRVQRHVLKKKMPLGLSNYSYGKRIFDAGVIFGVLSSISASRNFERNATRAAAEGLLQCIELLKDLEAWLRVKDGVPEPSTPPAMHELAPPRRVLEELAERAGIKIVDGTMEIVGPRRKRALYEMMEEGDSSWDGLILPFMMGGWVVGKSPAPTSWLGLQPEVLTPTSAAVVSSAPTLIPATPLSAQPIDEHRSKRACRTNIGGIAQYPPEVLAGNSSGDEGSAYGDYRAKKRESARPTSARPVIAVRARVADGAKRPKRRVAPGGTPIKQTKSESPSLDEEDEDRFAYNITKEGQEFTVQYSPTEYPPQPAPSAPTHQHQLAPSSTTTAPQPVPAPAPTSMVVDARSAAPPAETIAGNDTPHTPQIPSSATFQGYTGEVWSENSGDMFGQSMMQNHHMYSATGLMLGQPSESYMHQHQQPQAHHHTHHAPPPSQPPSMQPQYSHPPQPIRHEYPQHIHYPAPHQQPYSGYSNVDTNARPHLVIDAGMNGAGNQGSQPTSAVTMPDANTFYSHPSSMPVQSIAPSALYTQPPQQEQYSSGWNPTQDYYRY